MDFPPQDIQDLVNEIASILRSRNETLAISEAACGGLLLAYLISVPGASNFYIGGKLVYSTRQRLKLSGWTDEEISHYVGPSEQVALKLARTTKYELGSTYVLSETGFAGPSKDLHLSGKNDITDHELDPDHSGAIGGVGTVYLGLTGPNGESSSTKRTGSISRSVNMTEFANLGLQFLLTELKKL